MGVTDEGHETGGKREAAAQKRRREILLAGKKMFFRNGYQLTNVDAIAEEAGTTKRTIYGYFGSKEDLFTEVIGFAGAQFVTLLPEADKLPPLPGKGIRAYIAKLREVLASPDIVRFQRLVIAEAGRQPELGRALRDTAFADMERVLADYLDACVAEGRLRPHDTGEAAGRILDAATSSLRLRTLMGLKDSRQEGDETKAIEKVVDEYLDRHAAGKRRA